MILVSDVVLNEAGLYLHTSFTQVWLKVDGRQQVSPELISLHVASGIHFNLEDARHFECGRGGHCCGRAM